MPEPVDSNAAVPGATQIPAPSGTPSQEQVPAAGEMEIAKSRVSIAMALLEQQLPVLGSDTEEGSTLLKALSLLSKQFSGKKSADLAPAELMQTMSAQPDAVKQQILSQMQPPTQGAPGGPQVKPPQFA